MVDICTKGNYPKIVYRDIVLPYKSTKLAFTLENVFTAAECREYIKLTEKKGYDPALLNMGGGRQILATEARNNTRCIWDSEEEAEKIWARIKDYVPPKWAGKPVRGLNERLRFLRYDPEEYFRVHMDGCYKRDNGEQSYITVQLYLNEEFTGGSTTFIPTPWDSAASDMLECIPKTGKVLVFQHDLYHEGSVLLTGRKYAVRTDVMYGGPGPK